MNKETWVPYLVDFIERHMASNEFIKLHFSSKIFFYKLWYGITRFVSSKGCAFPYTASYQLEWSRAMINITDNTFVITRAYRLWG